MSNNATTSQKHVVRELTFGTKTAKRAAWEAWEFTVVGPLQIRVTNASYGAAKDDHAYVVTVAERNGVLIPAECECPADLWNEENACKHRVACAVKGGPLLLDAAAAFPTSTGDNEESDTITIRTAADRLATDGGWATDAEGEVEADATPPREHDITGPYTERDAYGRVTGVCYVRCERCGREALRAEDLQAFPCPEHRPPL